MSKDNREKRPADTQSEGRTMRCGRCEQWRPIAEIECEDRGSYTIAICRQCQADTQDTMSKDNEREAMIEAAKAFTYQESIGSNYKSFVDQINGRVLPLGYGRDYVIEMLSTFALEQIALDRQRIAAELRNLHVGGVAFDDKCRECVYIKKLEEAQTHPTQGKE